MIDGRRGSLHFIRFPTSQMPSFIELAQEKGMAKLASTLCATGGGAYKFQDVIESAVRLQLHKFDELDSLIRGVDYMENNNPTELFFYAQPKENGGHNEATAADATAPNSVNSDTWEKRAYNSDQVYPFMLVNIGSGVSILKVRGPNEYARVSGTSIGGGTFLGLCSLLTGCSTFEEALKLAAAGDNRRVDKLVKDIYGGDYERFDLMGDVVASSFGHMSCVDRRAAASPADLARATLVTITNNIGSLARLCARAEGIERVLFVGNFLRINSISMKLLASAMEFWSGGKMKALFCEHEGYFGALGCLLELMKTPEEKAAG